MSNFQTFIDILANDTGMKREELLHLFTQYRAPGIEDRFNATTAGWTEEQLEILAGVGDEDAMQALEESLPEPLRAEFRASIAEIF